MPIAPTAEAFRFDADSHTYWLGNRVLPSITQILDETGYIRDNPWQKPEHMYRGSYVHWCVRLINEGDLDMADIASEYRGYVDAYLNAQAKFNIVPVRCEVPRYHPAMMFAGTPDIVAEHDIWELKTGEILPWVALQTIGQDLLERAWDKPARRRRRRAIKLNANGTFGRPVDFMEWARDEALFRSLVNSVVARPLYGIPAFTNGQIIQQS